MSLVIEYIAEIKDEVAQYCSDFIHRHKNRYLAEKDREIVKWQAYSSLMFQWMRMRQKGRSLAEYLDRQKCKKIAIYGLGGGRKALLQ